MATLERTMLVSRDDVFNTLTTPETYPHWLVGARDIRAVDPGWPAVGTRFHHRVGLVGPLKVSDYSKVLEITAPRHLVLDVRARPFGRARATFDLIETAAGCTVRLHETPTGSAALLKPLIDPLLTHRNRRSLENLEDFLRQGRSHRSSG